MSTEVTEHGCWQGVASLPHRSDEHLAAALVGMVSDGSVVDFGCGPGFYVLLLSKQGVDAQGFDGNADTSELTNGRCDVLDLAIPQDLGRRWHTVLCLEVIEHIPPEFEAVVLDNLVNHCGHRLIVSWAQPGQGGQGHFNCRKIPYVKEQFIQRGMTLDAEATKLLRDCSTLEWFKNNLLVFVKEKE